MKRVVRVLFVMMLCLFTLLACANPVENHGREGDPSQTDSVTNQPPDASAKPPKGTAPIAADLNHDGVEDQILMTFDSVEKDIATIKVIDGRCGAELMTETLELHSEKISAYYLKIGKGNELDELVSWDYRYLPDGRLEFRFSVFSFNAAGERQEGDHDVKRFDLSREAAVAKGDYEFQTLLKVIGEHIWPSTSEYDAYLLLDNQGDELLYSTADKRLIPPELDFELKDFVRESD